VTSTAGGAEAGPWKHGTASDNDPELDPTRGFVFYSTGKGALLGDRARMADTVLADQRDEVDVAQQRRSRQKRGGDIDAVVGQPGDQPRRRGHAFRKGGGHVAPRFDGDQIEKRQRQVVELRDLAARRARERAERRDGGAEETLGLAGVAPDNDVPEICSCHG